ncbi:hypothetical protein CEXT_162271, partial [Caerostris extrusa]
REKKCMTSPEAIRIVKNCGGDM